MISLLTFLAMLVGFGALLFGGQILVTAPFLWIDIGFMIYCRRRAVILRTAACVLAIWFAAAVAFPFGNGAIIGFFLAVFLAPWPAKKWASAASFRADSEETRSAAADIRNLKLEREGAADRVSASKHWPGYIIDSERARLASVYQLPATFRA